MSITNQVVELGLQGKWIRAGRLWLEHNLPMPRQQAIAQLAKLMPRHIIWNQRLSRETQTRLASIVIYRHTKTIGGDIVVFIKPKRVSIGRVRISQFVLSGADLTIPFHVGSIPCDNKKERSCFPKFIHTLIKHGEAEKVGPGLFRLTDKFQRLTDQELVPYGMPINGESESSINDKKQVCLST